MKSEYNPMTQSRVLCQQRSWAPVRGIGGQGWLSSSLLIAFDDGDAHTHPGIDCIIIILSYLRWLHLLILWQTTKPAWRPRPGLPLPAVLLVLHHSLLCQLSPHNQTISTAMRTYKFFLLLTLTADLGWILRTTPLRCAAFQCSSRPWRSLRILRST